MSSSETSGQGSQLSPTPGLIVSSVTQGRSRKVVLIQKESLSSHIYVLLG